MKIPNSEQRKKWLNLLQMSVAKKNLGENKSLKVVIDSNIWYSAFFHQGKPATVLVQCLQEHVVITSDYLISEVKLIITKSSAYRSWCLRICKLMAKYKFDDDSEPEPNIDIRDPKDSPIVSLAIRSEANLLVTGDKDILEFKFTNRTLALTPEEFIKLKL